MVFCKDENTEGPGAQSFWTVSSSFPKIIRVMMLEDDFVMVMMVLMVMMVMRVMMVMGWS